MTVEQNCKLTVSVIHMDKIEINMPNYLFNYLTKWQWIQFLEIHFLIKHTKSICLFFLQMNASILHNLR